MAHGLPINQHISRIGIQQAGNNFQKNALSSSAWADNRSRSAFSDIQIDPIEDNLAAEAFVEIAA